MSASDGLAQILPQTFHDANLKMRAVEWQGKKSMKVVEKPRPIVTHPRDAIVRVTTAAVCGTDMHLYHNEFPGLEKGLTTGHEAVGVIDSIGPEAKGFQVGDRVVVSAVLACGQCDYCQRKKFALCENTNPSKEQEAMFGHRLSGVLGCGKLLGGYDGCQAEFVRVPLADVNLFKVPSQLADEIAVLLADIAPTALYAVDNAEVKPGDKVAVWGCGPVGLLCLAWAKFRGASTVVAVDSNEFRLSMAAKHTGALTVNFNTEKDVVGAVQRLIPGGPDSCIEAVGYNNEKTFLHKFQRKLMLETDSPTNLDECIRTVKKGGIVSIIGEYAAYCNQFPIGIMMEKGLTMRGGHVPVHKYAEEIIKHMVSGKFDPSFILTHRMPLERAVEAYEMFDQKEDECIKITLHSAAGEVPVSTVQSRS